MNPTTYLAEHAKAIVAALLAAVAPFVAAQTAGSAIDANTWTTAVIAAVAALLTVGGVPNKLPTPANALAAAVKAFVPVAVPVPPATQVEDYLPTPVVPTPAYSGPIPPVTPAPTNSGAPAYRPPAPETT